MKIAPLDNLYPLRVGLGYGGLSGSSGSNSDIYQDVLGAIASNASVSYGSNSTRVSEVAAAGALTTVSRADHIHDGIGTITASASNTMQRGTFNLRPGNNVSFGLTDTDGDGEFDTLTVNGAAGGGGGGTITTKDEGSTLSTGVTTIDFVGAGVTASGTGATTTVTISGGGSGASWTQDLDEDGTSFANWTAVGGTWSSNGTEIIQTNTAATIYYATFASIFAIGWSFIMEFEAYVVSGATGRAGFGMLDSSANNAGFIVYLQAGTGVVVELKGASVIRQFTTTINTATWYKIRLVVGSAWMSVYLDGTLLGSARLANLGWDTDMDYPSLYTYNGSFKFRNLKAWTLSGGEPA